MTSIAASRPLKPYSTRTMLPPAPEFERFFIEEGWSKVNRLYGKRCANRWYIMLGAGRLKAARERFKRGQD
jgi:hypothetical protein